MGVFRFQVFQLIVVVFHFVSFVGGTAQLIRTPLTLSRRREPDRQPESIGVATTCAEQGNYCECSFGKVRYGLEPDWSEWVWVGSATQVLCHHANAQFPQFKSVAWFATQYCQCERTEVKENVGRIPEGTVLYLFKVGEMEDRDPRVRVSPRVQQILNAKAVQLRGKTKAKSDLFWRKEFPKQAAVATVGVVAGVGMTALAAPVVAAAIATHIGVVAGLAIVGAAGANYVVSASAKGVARYTLQTDDRDKEVFSAQEAIVEIGAGAATLGIFQGAGLHSAMHGAIHSAMHGGHHGVITLGDKVVAYSSDSICETGVEKIHQMGIEAVTDAIGELVTTAHMDNLPEIQFQETTLGIILNLLLSGVGIESVRPGNGGYAGLAENLESLRRSAQEVMQSYGPGPVQHESFLTLAIAERTVWRIFHPNHDNSDSFRRAPGNRFPFCKDFAPSTEPVCYCLRHGYKPSATRAPILGVDIDFCVFNQACIPGEGVQNARCTWPSEEQVPHAQQMVGRLYLAYTNNVPNCFAQHLNGWRCTDCKQVGQECATEEFMGECQQITDGFSCVRTGEQINPDGTRKTPGQARSALVQRSLNKTPPPFAPDGEIILLGPRIDSIAFPDGLGGRTPLAGMQRIRPGMQPPSFLPPRPGFGGRTPLTDSRPLPKAPSFLSKRESKENPILEVPQHMIDAQIDSQKMTKDLEDAQRARAGWGDFRRPSPDTLQNAPAGRQHEVRQAVEAAQRNAAAAHQTAEVARAKLVEINHSAQNLRIRTPKEIVRDKGDGFQAQPPLRARIGDQRITDGFPKPPWQRREQHISTPLRTPKDISKAIFYCTVTFGMFFSLLACARHHFCAKPKLDHEAPLLPTLTGHELIIHD